MEQEGVSRMGRHRRHSWQGAAETRRGFVALTATRYRQECQKREMQEQMRAMGESIYANPRVYERTEREQ